jgi:hypothetical protein
VTDIFLSKPTWLDDSFRPGLSNFEELLRSLGFRPRSLGATDFGTRNPLRDVIALLEQCSGVVILGYPQVVVTAGRIKGVKITTQVLLSTEWNHIETGLACAKDLPLLVIHHEGVQRGVFDRGAIDAFLYSENLARPDWALSPDVSGAIRAWKASVDAHASAGAGSAATPKSPRAAFSGATGEELAVLTAITNAPERALWPYAVGRLLGMSLDRAEFHLEELRQRGLVDVSDAVGAPPGFFLTHEGRRLLVQVGTL